eukprot:CAMPEP_0170363784 /NCGR_PEP_ID=MMETSP0117_2-20130122/5035_1 /TAXON_ID=400756 /ORGANISM="Durinskia baltica, Strain CSIRO CS-38" /LENGTH=174 /DNA_ID=CAMNT_0010618261 /DNA_START=90 /DNA_END=614 /DNA_ORIENTATION=+
MTSLELQEKQRQGQERLILVDVRTEGERQVSIIPGAISLEEFTANLNEGRQDDESMFTVVTYCTIGYRSGLQAQQLQEKYPHLPRVYSLDGILAYSHTDAPLVDPVTGEPTRHVHAFARPWRPCANPAYEIHCYEYPNVLGRLVQVGGLVLVRGTQHLAHVLTKCCCCTRKREE